MIASRPASTTLSALIATALALASLLLAGPASAVPVLAPGPSGALSNPLNATDSSTLALSATGETAALWIERSGATYSVWEARRSPAGAWTPPACLFANDSALGFPQIIYNVDGNATALWLESVSPSRLWFSHAPSGGAFGAAQVLRTTFRLLSQRVDLAVSPSGEFFAGWGESNGSGQITPWAVAIGPSGVAGAATNLFPGSDYAYYAAIAGLSGGRADAFIQFWDGANIGYYVSHYTPSQGWVGPFLVLDNASDVTGYLHVAADASDRMTLVVDRHRSPAPPDIVASQSDAVGQFGPFLTVVNNTSTTNDMSFSLSADGSGFLLFTNHTGSGPGGLASVTAVRMDAAGNWSEPHEFTHNVAPFSFGAMAVSGGAAYFAFAPPSNSSSDVHVAAWSDGAGCPGFSAPLNSSLGQVAVASEHLTLGPNGAGLITFLQYNGAVNELRYAPISAAPPPRLTIDVPAAGAHLRVPVTALAGHTDPGTTVRTGGSTVVALADGSFSLTLPLQSGANQFVVDAVDPPGWEGCTYRSTVQVFFDDPLPAIEARLQQTQDSLNATRAALDQANASIASALASAAQAQAAAAAANGSAANLSLQLADALAASAAANRSAGTLQTNVTLLQTQLAAAQSDNAAQSKRIAALEANETAAKAQAPAGDGAGVAFAMALGAAGVAVGLFAFMRSRATRKAPPTGQGPADPPTNP